MHGLNGKHSQKGKMFFIFFDCFYNKEKKESEYNETVF